MTKKHHNRNHHNEDDIYHEVGFHDRLREHRRDKRMKNAIRSKNIHDLLHLNDDDE